MKRSSHLRLLLLLPLSLAAARSGAAQAALDAPPDGAPAVDHRHPGLHLEVDLDHRVIQLRDGAVALYSAQAAVGKPMVLEYEGRKWTFATPRGRRTVIGKERNPVWTPPDWHYVELAAMKGWQVVWLRPGDRLPLSDGRRLVVRGDRVGFEAAGQAFAPAPLGEEIVVADTLYVPPPGSRNRAIPGELGRFKLDLGDGYYIHGTPDAESIGGALTHGCIRLSDKDLEYLFTHVPLGTRVYVH